MPVAMWHRTMAAESPPQQRQAMLGPAGNGSKAVVFDERKRKSESSLSQTRRSALGVPALAVMNDRRTVVLVELAPMRTREERAGAPEKRRDWIALYSDPLYVRFQDEEWGVPVPDDKKLFELLVFSQSLAERCWPMILNNRDIFRKSFDNFDPSSVARLDGQSQT